MLDILIVCTANQCRSPLAEAILSRLLADRGCEAYVHSAGLYEGGWRATADATKVAAAAGLDLSRHRSTEVTAELVRPADLVIAMARAHARHLTVLAPEAWERIFPLKELVRRAEATDAPHPGEPVGRWLDALNAGRAREALLADDPAEDVADPVGLGPEAYRRTYGELEDLMGRLAPYLVACDPST